MANQRVYVETTIVSYLTSRRSSNTQLASHQEITAKWWRERGPQFDLVISELVHEEASAGDAIAAAKRLELLESLQMLPVSPEAVRLAGKLVAQGPIPREYDADALHIAVAALGGVDYLLTWNCKHLANAALRRKIENLVEDSGFECPIICTPEGIDGGIAMQNDPIVEEVRKARQEYAKRFNYDLHAMAKDLNEKEREHEERLIECAPKPVRKRLSA